MKRKQLYFLSLCAFFLSCTHDFASAKHFEIAPLGDRKAISDTSEFIVDSTNIGIKGQTKIELRRINYPSDSSLVQLRVFEKYENTWRETYNNSIPTNSLMPLEPTFEDFNNDGLNDVLIRTASSSRGANEIQTLLLYRAKTNDLVWINNSESFPNLEYNAELKCITAWVFTGGLTTFFMRIERGNLIEFAEVDQRDGRIVVTATDENGNRKEIKNIAADGYTEFAKFKNFDPLVEY